MLAHLLFALLVATLINMVVFLFAYRWQSDKLTDITYSLTFVVLVTYCILKASELSFYKWLVFFLVFIWAVRLGGFLLYRITQMGHDSRFDKIRINFWRFFRFFIIQGVGAWLIALPAMVAILYNAPNSDGLPGITIAGIILAFAGLILEVVADAQKSRFKNREGQSGKLFTGGLYRLVQYPNYTGEILFWLGIFISLTPDLYGLNWFVVIGPLTIIALLVFVSGIPYLEAGRHKKYGSDPYYQEYSRATSKLVPFIY